MKDDININNLLISKIIENSLFTNKQMQIIYNIYNNEKKPNDITSGAYYREVKQCRHKIRKLYYTFILLNLLNIIKDEQIDIINLIINKLNKLNDNHDKYHDNDLKNMINIIDQLLNKILF